MRVGLLGGTFNPPHLGHLVLAQEARAQLGLDEVLLVPARHPPHKAVPDDPGPERRLEMCELATGQDGGVEASRLELDLPAPSYTVATLRELHARRPGDDLTFIVGGDMAASLPEWQAPEEIVSLARLGVVERSGDVRASIAGRVAAVDGAGERVDYVTMPRLDISSTDIRARVAAGRPIRWLVPAPVAGYIAEHGLYRERVAG